jgi:hypothetical protein
MNWPARIIGPIARAGLTPAPLTVPLITMATARAADGHGGDAPRDPGVGGHRHDHQDQHEGDDGFGGEDPPRGNPGGRGRGAEGGDRSGLVPVQAPGDRGRGGRAGELGQDVTRGVGPWEAAAGGQPEGHRRVEVGAGNVAQTGDCDGQGQAAGDGHRQGPVRGPGHWPGQGRRDGRRW